jgi:formylglycine-generating enzyme required for sulfatase activity
MEFVLIPAGEFLMGSEDGGSDEKPVRRVQISKPFYLGKYPVIQEQWRTVMGNNPSHFKGDLNRPVENVSWQEVQDFLGKLTEKETGKTYRLPTEAEWEYACRAGSTGAYCFGDDETQLREYAWYGEGSSGTTHPVGQLKPNNWGLYDMHGNVWEWVQDWYAEDYYKQRPNPDTDPQGPEKGEERVLRGGCYWFTLRDARCAFRNWFDPFSRYVFVGFRIVVRS